jgi:type VI secretion system protein ImpJ
MMDTTLSPTLLPDPVLWSEGLLLSPQHLQQNDIYWHAQLRHRMSCITPHYWGVSRLTVDPSSLVTGNVAVTELACVLPDGLAVEFPGNYSMRTLDVDVGKLAKRDGKPVRVWLQLRKRGPAAARHDNAERRYDTLAGDTTHDENTGDGTIQVGRLQTVLALHADYATKAPLFPSGACPLFDVVRDPHGVLRIDAYHPPMLQAQASAFQNENGLQHKMEQLAQRVWFKMEELAGDRGEGNADDCEQAQAGPHLIAARYLSMALPPLEIAVHDPQAHPADLYRALAQLVGHVACIGGNPIPFKMKPYRHEDCMPQFQAAFDYVDAKLALINTAYECQQFVPIDIKGVGPVRFARALPADMDEVIVELKRRDGQSRQDLARWLHDARKVSESMIHAAQKSRMSANIHPLTEQEIRDRNLNPKAALFRIDNQKVPVEGKGHHDAFRPGQILLIHGVENNDMPAAIVLYRKKRMRHGMKPDAAQANPQTDGRHA